MIVKQEQVENKRIAIKQAHDHMYCVEVAQYAPDWCYPWEVQSDGWRACKYAFAPTIEQETLIFNEFVTVEKMHAKKEEQ